MRMWSLDPRLLDRQGLVAAWRESLLAQAVLAGNTKGYTNHPQLERFKSTSDPLAYVCAYLHGLADEADSRSYKFNRSRLLLSQEDAAQLLKTGSKIAVTTGQIDFEFEHLIRKLAVRNPDQVGGVEAQHSAFTQDPLGVGLTVVHPLFDVVLGGVEPWEKI